MTTKRNIKNELDDLTESDDDRRGVVILDENDDGETVDTVRGERVEDPDNVDAGCVIDLTNVGESQ